MTQFRVIFVSPKHWIVSAIRATIISLLVGNFLVYLKSYLIARRHQRQIQSRYGQQQRATNETDVLCVKRLKESAMNPFFVHILLLYRYVPRSLMIMMANIRYTSN